jgi:hypothetical protein
MKPVTTLMVGTSPEFELALYTLCFAAGQERNYVTIDRYDLLLRWVCHVAAAAPLPLPKALLVVSKALTMPYKQHK